MLFCMCCGCFDNDNIIHVDGYVDPIRDKETIDMELQLKDLETVDKKAWKSKKERLKQAIKKLKKKKRYY